MSAVGPGAGVLTFLIADVRGYTTYTQSHGDEAAARLASAFAEIAREGVEGHDGEVIELRGDEALAVFRSAREALRAAVDLQVTFADEVQLDSTVPLLVGIGLDAGEAVPVDGGYRGGALNLAARLCSQAKAGEVLVSQGVVHLARAVDGVRLHEYGELELKGLAEPVRVFRAAPRDEDPDELARRFLVDGRPPPQRTELPSPLDPVTPIVGRERDVRRLRWAWRTARRGIGGAVFITGPPGIGKTRLAAEGAGTAAHSGARVTYASFADRGDDDPSRADEGSNGRPAFVVLDDLEGASPEGLAAALELASNANGSEKLVVAVFDDERASPELLAAARRIAGQDRVLRPQPLGLEEIRRIAALYLGAAVDALPSGLLESSGGVPRLVHEQVSEWAQAEAAKRLGVFASQAAAGRSDLRSVEGDLAASVVDLQLVREQTRLFGTGPGRDALEPVESPYKGLASFGVDDAEWFYGRERLVAELIARLAGAPLLGVVGPSGSGKSSAVRAGLVPAIQAGVLPRSDEWIVVVMRPGEHPLRELDRALWSTLPERIRAELAGEDRPLRATRDVLGTGERLVVVIDQFEEVFTLCTDANERAAFLSAIVEAARDPHANEIVVLALRADFYGRFAANPELAELLGTNHVLVGPMTAEEYRRAIEQPALHAGVRIEPALVDELVGEVLGEPGALPLLSAALLELWERRDGRTIRAGEHAATGGVRGAVARLAEETYAGLTEEQKPIVRSVLLRLAGPGDGESVVRRRVPRSEFDVERDDVARVLDALADRRLLTVSEGTVEVAHEALLREWPRFQDWLEEDREGRRLHGHLTATAREWAEREHDPAELYRGARLSSALDWTTEHTLDLNELEREFVNTSRAASQLEAERQQRTNRRLRTLLAGAGVLLVFALVAGAVALAQRSSAKKEARVALARELGARAVAEPRIDRAMLLAREAVNLDHSRQTAGTLLATLLRSPAALATFSSPITDRPQRITLSPDGRTLAATENTNFVRFYDTRTGQESHRPLQNHGFGSAAVYSQDGKLLLVPGGEETPGIDLLDANTMRRLHYLPLDKRWLTTPTSFVEPLLTSPDDRTAYLAYAVLNPDRSDGPVYVDRWDLQTGKLLGTTSLGSKGMFDGHMARGGELVFLTATDVLTVDGKSLRPLASSPVKLPVESSNGIAVVSPDGRTVAFAGNSGAVSFVDVRTGQTMVGAGKTGANVPTMAFSPKGDVLVSTSESGEVTVWNPATADPLETFTGHEGRVLGTAFSADGKTLYTCSLDGAVFKWDLGSLRRFGRPFQPFPALTDDHAIEHEPLVAVSPDGKTLATAPGGNRVLLVSLRTLRRVREYDALGQDTAVNSIAWSPNGSLLAAGGGKGRLRLWNLAGRPRLVGSLDGLTGTVQQMAFSPDGSLVAAVDGDKPHGPGKPTGHLAVWRVDSGASVAKAIDLHTDGWTVAFSPDGQFLVAGDDDGAVRVFDARSVHLERTLQVTGGTNTSLAFAPDNTLETGSWAGIVQHWDVSTGKQLGHPVLAMPSPVSTISFDPSGSEFATAGGSDGFVKLWDTRTLQQLGSTFPGDPGKWASAAFTPDGSELVTLYETGRGTVWPATVGAWEEHACAVAGRNFTREEWRRFVTGRSYSTVCGS
jgi:WD40 repeat protein/class 3 adenylate cyclase